MLSKLNNTTSNYEQAMLWALYDLYLEEKQTVTIDDIYKLPEGTWAELIDGQIYNMAPPKRIHPILLNVSAQAAETFLFL